MDICNRSGPATGRDCQVSLGVFLLIESLGGKSVSHRPEGYRSLPHRSFGRASQAGLAILMTRLALGRRFILCSSLLGLGWNHTECLVFVNPSERRRTARGPPMCRPLWPQEIY
jgi:hypothetical protein